MTISTQKSHSFMLSWCEVRPAVRFWGIFTILTLQIWELISLPAQPYAQQSDIISALLRAIGFSPVSWMQNLERESLQQLERDGVYLLNCSQNCSIWSAVGSHPCACGTLRFHPWVQGATPPHPSPDGQSSLWGGHVLVFHMCSCRMVFPTLTTQHLS